jgi:uncharacterized protein
MIETKDNPISQCQLKLDNDVEWKFEGYLSVFNSNDQINDTVLPGAFTKTLKTSETYPLFINHEQKGIPLGEIKGIEDDYGLYVQGEINPDHFMAKTAHSAMRLKHLRALSMGYCLAPSGFEKKSDGRGRVLKEVELMEGSLVTFPCDKKALITGVKMEPQEFNSMRDFEHHLRDVYGASKSEAVAFVSLLVKHIRSDSGPVTEQTKGMDALLQNALSDFGKRFT